jgi:hypothetical protein
MSMRNSQAAHLAELEKAPENNQAHTLLHN